VPLFVRLEAGIVQSAYRLATGLKKEGLKFESQLGQEFSLLHVVQTGSGAYPASYPINIGSLLSGLKRPGI
jgi:hypothetical protein